METHAIWSALAAFTNLRELSLHNPLVRFIPEEALQHMSRLDSVKLSASQEVPRIAARIGAAVTTLDTLYESEFSLDEISALMKFLCLRELKCRITSQNEVALLETVQRLPELVKLGVSWESDDCNDRSGRLNDQKVSPGLLLRTVQVATKLHTMSLYGLRIPSSELEEVLKCMGRRLQRFAFSSGLRGDAPLRRLCFVLMAVAKYNPELKALYMRCGMRYRSCTGDELTHAQKQDQELGPLARTLLERLEQSLPLLRHHMRDLISLLSDT